MRYSDMSSLKRASSVCLSIICQRRSREAEVPNRGPPALPAPLRSSNYKFSAEQARTVPPEEDHIRPLPGAFAKTTPDGYNVSELQGRAPGVVGVGSRRKDCGVRGPEHLEDPARVLEMPGSSVIGGPPLIETALSRN
ncbi:hypothetical protein B0H63DRAFT_508451 [Podospora didyma]|uniref:Uncharacterized protein n=1 Tax=Podospora didyma TaxID=330526 RepID=A0AAE0P156_9PEZI|nr:hypothetical protein B0H63DRAFT_508451 [Podospora didyma]